MLLARWLLLSLICFIVHFSFVCSLNTTVVCSPGYQRVVSANGVTSCSACAEGYYGYQMNCYACPSGYYTDKTGQGVCEPCPAGQHSTLQNASTSCTQCLAGSYSAGGAGNCTLCPAGRYSSGKDASYCTGCPVGESTSGSTGATGCSSCPSGTYAPNIGTPECINCSPGTYALAGSTTCTPCAPGTFTSAPGQSSCQSCGNAVVAQSYGQTACVPCYLGLQPANTSAAQYCVPCAPGTQNPLASGFCTPCPFGSASPFMATINCPYCMGGQYASTQGLIACQACPLNTYSSYQATGQTQCSNCASGSISFGNAFYCYD